MFRTFHRHPDGTQLAETLHRVTYAYHLPSTRVSVDGRVVRLARDYAPEHGSVCA